MVKALTVTPSAEARTMPASDLTLTLTNYYFAFSTSPTAGQHILRIVNNGTQPHEAEILFLEPGKENTLLLSLSNGDYALICFMPDAKDGKAHAAHG